MPSCLQSIGEEGKNCVCAQQTCSGEGKMARSPLAFGEALKLLTGLEIRGSLPG